jgi:hypothetical protein
MKRLLVSSIVALIVCLLPFVASGKGFLLQDEFTTPLAAGSVHGTTSEPSGHTRTVTDTENKISIADGKLTFSGGKESPSVGDPAIWYPAIDRVAGRMLMLDYAASSQLYSHFGFDNDQTTLTGAHRFGMTADKTYFSVESGYIYPYTNDSSYKLSSILRANGQFAFLSENNAPWRLLWMNASSNLTPLYPVVSNYSSVFTSSFIRIPNTLWLPTPLASDGFSVSGTTDGKGHAEGVAGGIGEGGGGLAWQSGGTTWSVSGAKAINSPTITGDGHANVVVNGTFTTDANWAKGTGWTIDTADSNVAEASSATSELSQTNGTTGTWYLATFDLVTRTAGSVSLFGGATPYVSTPATYTHASRATSTKVPFFYGSSFSGTIDNVVVVPLTLSELISVVETSTRDVIATVAIAATPNGTQAGLAIGIDSATDPKYGVIAYHDGTNCKLDKLVNGVWTNVISAAATWANDAELRVIKDGTTYRVYYNNALVGTATISDESIINNTRHGLFSTHSSIVLDNFTLYARGTGNEYNILNQLMSTTSGGSLNLLGVGK